MKKSKFLKTLGFSCMAVFMGSLTVLAGCAPAPMSTNSQPSTTTTGLGLDPETDPIVFTTESGLQIKKSNAKYGSTTTTTTNTGYTYTQDLSSFYYFTMGTFSGKIYHSTDLTSNYDVSNEPINWLIIGRGEMPVADSTPAGSAIQGDAGKQEIAMGSSIYENLNLSAIPENTDIPKGHMLVISEKLLGQCAFNSTATHSTLWAGFAGCTIIQNAGTYGNRYRYYGNVSTRTVGEQTWTESGNAGGTLYNYINNLFSKNTSGTILSNTLGFTDAQANLIVPQQLYTYYTNGTGYNYAETPSTDGGTYYTMFPLAYRAAHTATKQNFCVEDYLKTTTSQVACLMGSNTSFHWWTRSGATGTSSSWVNHFRPDSYVTGYNVSDFLGVRPAMVMKLQ